VRALGYSGGYSAVKDALRELRPAPARRFEHRFETGPGQQAQVDFAQFKVIFADDPEEIVTVWLFTLLLAHSRYLWGEFVWHQDLLTVLRTHVAAFAALGGSPREILYDRMKTAVLGEASDGIIYNARLQALARHYGFTPRACAAYRAKTKGKVERPYRYIRQDFFLGRSFQNLADLNAQFRDWLGEVANRRRHGTTHRPIETAFATEQRALQPLPALPFNTTMALERRISHDGMVSFNGNVYSVPDGIRGRAVELQVSLSDVQIIADGQLVAS
jgi:transposase